MKVSTQDVRDSAVFTMLEAYRHIIEEEPPQLLFPERLTRLVARGKLAEALFGLPERCGKDAGSIKLVYYNTYYKALHNKIYTNISIELDLSNIQYIHFLYHWFRCYLSTIKKKIVELI